MEAPGQPTLSPRVPSYNALAFSPDGKKLVCAAGVSAKPGEELFVWDAQTWQPLKPPTGLSNRVHSVAFSPDSKFLVTGSSREIDLCDCVSWTVVCTLDTNVSLPSVSFLADGRTVASLDGETIKLWDTRTAKLIKSLTAPSTSAVMPDAKTLITHATIQFGIQSPFVSVWDAESGKLRATFAHLPSSNEEPSEDWITYTPEGYYTASAGAKQFIRWRVGEKLFPAETYERQFHRPDLVQKALAEN